MRGSTLGPGLLISLLAHFAVLLLSAPAMRSCEQSTLPPPTAAAPDEAVDSVEVVSQLVEDEVEEPDEAVEEETPIAEVDPPEPTPPVVPPPTPRVLPTPTPLVVPPPVEPPPPKPPEDKKPEPVEDKKTEPPPPMPIQEQGKIAVNQPLVEKESEPPPDTPYIGPQDRRVAEEMQPRKRSLNPSDTAPQRFNTKHDASDKDRDAKDDHSESIRPEEVAGATAEPPRAEPPPEPRPPKPQPAAQAARKAERAGALPSPAPTPVAPEQGLAAAEERFDPAAARAGAPATEAPLTVTPPKPPGTGAAVDVNAALAIDPARYEEMFGKRDADARDRVEARPDRFLGRWNKRAQQMRASLENFTAHVKYGNQMFINTRASVYALYLNAIHQLIHRRWAFDYLRHLDLNFPMGHPLSNPELDARIEFVIDARTGQVEECNIVGSSGELEYDAEAVRVCHESSPGQQAPAAIVSPDGKVYLHWNFWRDTRQCGTFGASIYVLDNEGSLDTYKVTQPLDDLDGRPAPRHR